VVHCCLLSFITVASLSETLLKVFREKGIEDGIHSRVGILQAVGKQDDNHQCVALLSARRLTDKRQLCHPVREPADDVDSDHSEDQFCHLPVRLSLTLASLLTPWTHGPQLDNHQDIEYKDECKGPEEAEDEYVEGEGGLPVDDVPLALPQQPDHVAAVPTVASGDGGGVEEDGQHQDGRHQPGGE